MRFILLSLCVVYTVAQMPSLRVQPQSVAMDDPLPLSGYFNKVYIKHMAKIECEDL